MRLDQIKQEPWLCNHCSMCTESINDASGFYTTCPLYRELRFEDSSARGHNTVALYLLEGILKYSPEVARCVFNCTTCASCEEICKPMGNMMVEIGGSPLKTMIPPIMRSFGERLDPVQSVQIVETMRADCVDLGLAPEPVMKRAVNVAKSHNPYGEPHSDRMKWTEGLNLSQTAETVLFAGCSASYRRQEIAASTAKILRAAGVRFGVLPDEWCCGSPLLRTGYFDLAEKTINHNVELLKGSGAKTVITACAECYMAIARDWPKVVGDLPFKVRHITQVWGELIPKRKLKLKRSIKAKVAYHDPCHLGRAMGVYEEPRGLLRAIPGLELVEMYPARHAGWCCGAGGGLKESDPELALAIGMRKIPLIKEIGASILASACPFCKTHFTDAMAKAGESIIVKDVTELVAESMGV